MKKTKRTLLIIEDDSVINKTLKLACVEVLKSFPHVDGDVFQAFTYRGAKQIFDHQVIDFASIDLALSEEEQGQTDQEREQHEVGGINLLKNLQGKDDRPISIIVSGETLQSYAIDAYSKFNVLAFFQKARFELEDYKKVVKTVLSYLDAYDALSQLETELDLQKIENQWLEIKAATQDTEISNQDWPENLGDKIELVRSKRTEAVTQLPNSHWTETQFRQKVIGQKNWTFIRATIQGFGQFVTAYASQEEAILFFTANLLKKARSQFHDPNLFIGHLGHATEPSFIIIPTEKMGQDISSIAAWLKEEFRKTGVEPFLPVIRDKDFDPELTFSLETKVFTSEKYTFHDLHDLLDTLGANIE